MGDVIGDINSRRGRIEGMDDLGGGKIVRGYVPLSEMFGYSTDFVPELRDVETTQCSSKNMSQFRSLYRKRFYLTKTHKKYEKGLKNCTL